MSGRIRGLARRLPEPVRAPLRRAARSRLVTAMRGPQGLVLAYHRVAYTARDPFGLCVRPDHFAEHLDVLPGLADVVPLTDVRGSGRRGRRRVSITFDDGYADNVEVAAPMLAERGIAATFFLATGGLDPDSEFWWDRLEHMVLDASEAAPPTELRIDGEAVSIDTRGPDSKMATLVALNRRLRTMTPTGIGSALAELGTLIGDWSGACEHHRRLSPTQARVLLEAGEIGAHTRSHPLLPSLDDESARDEIAGSRDDAASIAGAPVRHFAYPFGMAGAFDRRTARLVREAGFDAAFINLRGLVRSRTNPYLLPRVAVGDVRGADFSSSVERWFAQL